MIHKLKIKKGDKVIIIAGDDKGKEGEVLSVKPKTSQVFVSSCNVVKKTVKPNDENKTGGFERKEMPIHISNIKKV